MSLRLLKPTHALSVKLFPMALHILTVRTVQKYVHRFYIVSFRPLVHYSESQTSTQPQSPYRGGHIEEDKTLYLFKLKGELFGPKQTIMKINFKQILILHFVVVEFISLYSFEKQELYKYLTQ